MNKIFIHVNEVLMTQAYVHQIVTTVLASMKEKAIEVVLYLKETIRLQMIKVITLHFVTLLLFESSFRHVSLFCQIPNTNDSALCAIQSYTYQKKRLL